MFQGFREEEEGEGTHGQFIHSGGRVEGPKENEEEVSRNGNFFSLILCPVHGTQISERHRTRAP